MSKLIKKFIYDIANDYLEQSNSLGKTAEWTYNGPDKIWVFVDQETNKLDSALFYTKEMDGDLIPTPLGTKKIEVDCSKNPLFCTLVGASEPVDGSKLPQHSEVLPNGSTYQRPLCPMPDHTFDIETAIYNENTDDWTYDWKKTWVTWDDIRHRRDWELSQTNLRLKTPDLPEKLKINLETYKQQLTDLEVTWVGYPAYKVELPKNPLE